LGAFHHPETRGAAIIQGAPAAFASRLPFRIPPAWLAEYLHELTGFPRGKHDVQVDSTAQMLDWFKQAGREPGGIYQCYKELARDPQAARPELGPPPLVT
jgi:hypothetical protein